jgi:hypothetical protein
VPAVEGRETVADARAATDPLRHQAETVDGASHVAVAQRGRHMRQPGMEHEGFGFAECIDHSVQEPHEEGSVQIHRA